VLLQLVTVSAIADGEVQAVGVLAALEDACDLIERDGVSNPSTVADARAVLTPALATPADPTTHHVSAIGHAHIDTAWLWPIRETKRKCARTFSNALRLMEDYPDYKFSASQAQQYQWIKEGYPQLYDRIRAQVAEGRFEPVGSMWVEADCNLPSGESLVRQLVHGKRFFLDELGRETTDLWLPDVFGYSAALPQILKEAGVTNFLTQKISWNDVNRFPHSTFWWEGIDGTRVLTHFPPADTYNGNMSLGEVAKAARQHHQSDQSNRSLYPFGYGLSYTNFAYSNLRLDAKSVKAGEPVKVTVDVTNIGDREGDEVVQLYLTDVAASAPVPIRALVGFERISLRPREKRTVTFTITPRQMSLIDDRGKRVIEPGEFLISVGGLRLKFSISGNLLELSV